MKVIPLNELHTIIKNDDVIALAALSVANLPAELLKHMTKQHDDTGKLTGLTFMLANDISNYADGIDLDALVERGMIKRLIMSIIIASPATVNAIKHDALEAYFIPQGVMTTHYRSATSASPGMITKIGLNTTADPRYQGGKANDRTTEDLVDLIEINKEQYLHYKFPNIDVALLRGTYADEKGNIYMHHETHLGEGFSVAAAAHNNNGTVIVQVKAIVANGSFNPNEVFIPSELVDYVVVNKDPKYHKQVMQKYYDPALAGHYRIASMAQPQLDLTDKKLILRRAAQFLTQDDVVSVGFGINNDLSQLLIEEKVTEAVQLNIDTGTYGGLLGSGMQYGMNYNLDAKMRHDMTWDFIYNGGIDIAFLSFGEVDADGNVNVSLLGDKMNGCGGFIDISQTVKTIIFSGKLVVGGQLNIQDDHITIAQEGTPSKFVDTVQHIDFNANYARSLGQTVYYVTERAVFQLVEDGIELIEIAPGVDLQHDVLDKLSFQPLIADKLHTIDSNIYRQHWGMLYKSL